MTSFIFELTWGDTREQGFVTNDTYPSLVRYHGVEHKPTFVTIPVYKCFIYKEHNEEGQTLVDAKYSDLDGTEHDMTDDQKVEVRAAAVAWIQPLGQAGNADQAQIDDKIKAEAMAFIIDSTLMVAEDMLLHLTIDEKTDFLAYRLNMFERSQDASVDAITMTDNVKSALAKFRLDALIIL